MADPDLNIKDVIDALDSFYCHNVVAGLWADAVANRLEGLAIYLLSDELPEVAERALDRCVPVVVPGLRNQAIAFLPRITSRRPHHFNVWPLSRPEGCPVAFRRA